MTALSCAAAECYEGASDDEDILALFEEVIRVIAYDAEGTAVVNETRGAALFDEDGGFAGVVPPPALLLDADSGLASGFGESQAQVFAQQAPTEEGETLMLFDGLGSEIGTVATAPAFALDVPEGEPPGTYDADLTFSLDRESEFQPEATLQFDVTENEFVAPLATDVPAFEVTAREDLNIGEAFGGAVEATADVGSEFLEQLEQQRADEAEEFQTEFAAAVQEAAPPVASPVGTPPAEPSPVATGTPTPEVGAVATGTPPVGAPTGTPPAGVPSTGTPVVATPVTTETPLAAGLTPEPTPTGVPPGITPQPMPTQPAAVQPTPTQPAGVQPTPTQPAAAQPTPEPSPEPTQEASPEPTPTTQAGNGGGGNGGGGSQQPLP